MYTHLISACRWAAEWRQELALLADMESSVIGLTPNDVHFSAAISVCEFGKQWEWALALMTEMQRRGLLLNNSSCGAVISACEKGKQWERACLVLFEMGRWHVQPDAINYNAVISAFGKFRRWQDALHVLRLMKSRAVTPTLVSFSALISACEKQRQWETVAELLTEMQMNDLMPDEAVLNASMAACESASQWAQAVALLTSVPRRGLFWSAEGCNAAVSACAKGREWERALLLLSFALNNEGVVPSIICFNSVLLRPDARQWGTAVRLVEELKSLQIAPDMATFRGVAAACVASAQPAQVTAAQGGALQLLADAACRAPPGIEEKEDSLLEAVLAAGSLRVRGMLPCAVERAMGRRLDQPVERSLVQLAANMDDSDRRCWHSHPIASGGKRRRIPRRHQWRVHDASLQLSSTSGL